MRITAPLITGLVFPVLVFAATYDTSHLPYSDMSSQSRSTQVAVSALTDAGIVSGNPDGTFRPSTLLNRAEYVKVIMGLTDFDLLALQKPCFPDVPAGIWYEDPVCRAKAVGIVEGNALEGIDPSKWQFKPTRSVNYAEAVKMLIELYDLPHQTTDIWYDGYIAAAESRGIGVSGIAPGDMLTRAQMAELVAGFYADAHGELAALRSAQRGETTSSSASSSSSRSSSSSSASSVSSSRSSSSVAVLLDTYGDTTIRPQFLLLGSVTPVLGAATIFSNAEPIDVRSISVNFVASAASSIRAVLLFDGDGHFLGRAPLDPTQPTNRAYKLELPSGTFTIPKREDTKIYARADLATKDNGGITQTTVTISNFTVEGNGVWSADPYTKSSSESYADFQTARATITKIARSGQVEGVLAGGTDQTIGTFTFEGKLADGLAHLDITSLTFDLTKSNNVTLTNVRLGIKGFPEKMDCTSSSTAIACPSISSFYGSLKEGPKDLVVVADVQLQDSEDAFLALSIGAPGSLTSPGAIAWTDGTANFTWVAFDSPVVIGTRYER